MATGRFAPSPTGPLHLGNLRTALLAWLFARSAGSTFVIRIEDLDPVAANPDLAWGQLADLGSLGLDWDGPIVWQSERRHHYARALRQLDADDLVYPCFCTRREIADAASAPHGDLPEGAYPGTCRGLSPAERAERVAAGRPAALRVRAGGAEVAFNDRVYGEQTGRVDDFVVRRNDGIPAYNLAVVVDDAGQRVQEVIRGDDLLSSTARQIWLARVLGLTPPAHAHVPMVLGPDGRRLAKRDGAVTLADRKRSRGESAAMVRSRLAASLGLAEPGEPVTMVDLLARFEPDAVPRRPWVLSPADL